MSSEASAAKQRDLSGDENPGGVGGAAGVEKDDVKSGELAIAAKEWRDERDEDARRCQMPAVLTIVGDFFFC